jgi:hypothetical protein
MMGFVDDFENHSGKRCFIIILKSIGLMERMSPISPIWQMPCGN